MITWSDNYLMGIEQFDKDHQKIFKLAKQVLELMRNRDHDPRSRMFVIQESLTYVKNHFNHHIAQEEAYMREINYEGYALHKMLHDDFRNIQIEKYQKIVESGSCGKEDIWDFIGTGLGWLLEHIATDDMAIIGKGILAQAKQTSLNEAALEEEVNLLLTSSLNIKPNAKIASRNYRGEDLGKVVHQKMIYNSDAGDIQVVSGIETSFLLNVAKMIYGSEVENETELVLSSLQLFATHFWRTLGQRFIGKNASITVKESSFIVPGSLSEELANLKPTTSILFTTDLGKFFIASNFTSLLPQP